MVYQNNHSWRIAGWMVHQISFSFDRSWRSHGWCRYRRGIHYSCLVSGLGLFPIRDFVWIDSKFSPSINRSIKTILHRSRRWSHRFCQNPVQFAFDRHDQSFSHYSHYQIEFTLIKLSPNSNIWGKYSSICFSTIVRGEKKTKNKPKKNNQTENEKT